MASLVCRQVTVANGVTGLLIYSQGERDGEECHILCVNQSLRLKQIVGHCSRTEFSHLGPWYCTKI